MTFKEKLMQEHPEYVSNQFIGGCHGCPADYGYITKKEQSRHCSKNPKFREKCWKCWNKEILERENNMKFKAGDKVRVKSNLEVGKKYGSITFLKRMEITGVITIHCVKKEGVIRINGWNYSPEMLEPLYDYKERENNMKFKVDDKVVVREWEDMEREFGLDCAEDIKMPKCWFIKGMRYLCGQTLKIKNVSNDCYKVFECEYVFTDEMLMPFDFSKSDLKDGDMLKIRDGDIYMWLNGEPKSLKDGFGHIECTTDDLKNEKREQFDIMEVRDSKDCHCSITDLFRNYYTLPVIWVRKKEPVIKEISMNEVKEILKEKFPDADDFKINTIKKAK